LMALGRRLEHKQVSFFIENGHKNMGQLGSLVRDLRQHGWRRCGPCQFNSKKELRPLQTADVWAYELAKHARDRFKTPDRPIRKSLVSLVEGNRNWMTLGLN